MEKITDRKQVHKIMFMFAVTYMVSYITRINFGAVIAEVIRDMSATKSELSVVVTGSFITYALGQVVSGMCGDRINPKLLVFWGLIATALMNITIPLLTTPTQMTIVWGINGFAQAFMWPPMVRMMAEYFNGDDYNNSCIFVSWGSSAGTIIVYLVAPLIITLSGWKNIFYFSATIGIVMAFLWYKVCPNNVTAKSTREVKSEDTSAPFITPVLVVIMIVVILHGAVRDGIITWMPSFLSETFNMSSSVSILSGIVLPIFSVICLQVASAIFNRFFKSPVAGASLFFAAGAVCCAILSVVAGKDAVSSVIFSALASGFMHGVNLMLISILPRYFSRQGRVSTVSGLLNACTYGGSAISTYGIALIAENLGWNSAIVTWTILALAGTGLCLISFPSWKKKYGDL